MKKSAYYFDSIAQQFERLVHPFDLAARREWFACQLDRFMAPGTVVLDVGCGLGHFSSLVLERGGYPVPLDLGGHLLARVKPTMPACVRGDALALPFPDNSFACVISSECVEHTSDPAAAIREMSRVLRPQGIVILSTPNAVWRWSVTLAEGLGLRKFAGIENFLTRRQVRGTLTAAGTAILIDQGLYLFPFQLRPLWPVLTWLNRRGQALRSVMINQCWVARKL